LVSSAAAPGAAVSAATLSAASRIPIFLLISSSLMAASVDAAARAGAIRRRGFPAKTGQQEESFGM
jgi:hypothetical protein